MSKQGKILQKTFVVKAHNTKEVVDKEPIFSVVLKTEKEAETVMSLKVESTSESIFGMLPLNVPIEVQLTNPQAQLQFEE